jgi:hypothetical protein
MVCESKWRSLLLLRSPFGLPHGDPCRFRFASSHWLRFRSPDFAGFIRIRGAPQTVQESASARLILGTPWNCGFNVFAPLQSYGFNNCNTSALLQMIQKPKNSTESRSIAAFVGMVLQLLQVCRGTSAPRKRLLITSSKWSIMDSKHRPTPRRHHLRILFSSDSSFESMNRRKTI